MNTVIGWGIRRTLIYFDIQGTLPPNVKIKKAYLTLSASSFTLHHTINVQLLLMNKTWDERTATWNSNGSESWNGVDLSGLARLSTKTFDDTKSTSLTLEIPANIVSNWLNDVGNNNNGVLLKTENEDGYYIDFFSNEAVSFYTRPLLSVYYTLP